MKKILSVLLVLSMLLSASAALAEGMGVQVIGGPAVEVEPVSLDDIKLNVDVEIDGYAVILPTAFSFTDTLGHYREGETELGWDADSRLFKSGNDAEFAILRMDLTNLGVSAKSFLTNAEVKVVYDDKYEYAGWFYQYNYDNKVRNDSNYGVASNKQNTEFVIMPSDFFEIGPMYAGHYVFGCTLPNAVIDSKAPLRMEITIDGNEITYNIRK